MAHPTEAQLDAYIFLIQEDPSWPVVLSSIADVNSAVKCLTSIRNVLDAKDWPQAEKQLRRLQRLLHPVEDYLATWPTPQDAPKKAGSTSEASNELINHIRDDRDSISKVLQQIRDDVRKSESADREA